MLSLCSRNMIVSYFALSSHRPRVADAPRLSWPVLSALLDAACATREAAGSVLSGAVARRRLGVGAQLADALGGLGTELPLDLLGVPVRVDEEADHITCAWDGLVHLVLPDGPLSTIRVLVVRPQQLVVLVRVRVRLVGVHAPVPVASHEDLEALAPLGAESSGVHEALQPGVPLHRVDLPFVPGATDAKVLFRRLPLRLVQHYLPSAPGATRRRCGQVLWFPEFRALRRVAAVLQHSGGAAPLRALVYALLPVPGRPQGLARHVRHRGL
mmetsp:Transcript_89187/g.252885  ORF Transcript_89187/g.252885 Transcript_89187/m.252885 type:complete len:270 (-) Transcript_89187:1987-2796(-)